MKCPTQNGPSRCERGEVGHDGPCEARAPEVKRRTLEQRVSILEQQVASLQMAMPRGIPHDRA